MDLNEGDSGVLVDLAGRSTVGNVGRDERGDGDGGVVGEELGDLTNAADVLVPVGLGESEVLVEAEADVVACDVAVA